MCWCLCCVVFACWYICFLCFEVMVFSLCSDALCCIPLAFLVFLYGLVVYLIFMSCLVLLYALGLWLGLELGWLGVRGWE